MKGFPDLPPVWLLAGLGAAWVLAEYLPLVTLFGPVFRGFGVLLGLAGGGVILWSGLWFWRKKTTIEPHHTPKALIVEGPYRFSRNPIYLGMVAILTGSVLWHGVMSPVLLPVVFVSVLTTRFIEPEEAALRDAFGAEAERYLQDTRRWL